MKNEGIKGMLEWRDKHLHSNGTMKVSSTKGDNRGRAAKIRVACPTCNEGISTPDKIVYTNVDGNARVAQCRAGHRFPIGGHSYSGARPYPPA